MTTKTVDLQRLQGMVGLKFSVHRWGNRGKADKSKLETDADKDRISVTKSLLVAKEFNDVCEYERLLRKWVRSRTMPSFFSENIYLVKVDAARAITEKLETSAKEFSDLVDKFIEVYPERVKASKPNLKSQFNTNDYPDANDMRQFFSIEFCWVSFSTPEALPPELRQKEEARLEKQFSDAADCIMLALREGFSKLVSKAAEQLVVKPGEKPKKFYDSSIEQIVEFIDTFNQRNLTNDVELEKLITQAKAIIGDPGKVGELTEQVRESTDVREKLGKKFEALTEAMSGMIEVKKTRRIVLED